MPASAVTVPELGSGQVLLGALTCHLPLPPRAASIRLSPQVSLPKSCIYFPVPWKALTIVSAVLPPLFLFIHLSAVLVETGLALINKILLLYLLLSTLYFFGNGAFILPVSCFKLAFSSTELIQFIVVGFWGLSMSVCSQPRQ